MSKPNIHTVELSKFYLTHSPLKTSLTFIKIRSQLIMLRSLYFRNLNETIYQVKILQRKIITKG